MNIIEQLEIPTLYFQVQVGDENAYVNKSTWMNMCNAVAEGFIEPFKFKARADKELETVTEDGQGKPLPYIKLKDGRMYSVGHVQSIIHHGTGLDTELMIQHVRIMIKKGKWNK